MRLYNCPLGHSMKMMTYDVLRSTDNAYSTGGQCDKCHRPLFGAILHCEMCRYDLCENCVNGSGGCPHIWDAPHVATRGIRNDEWSDVLNDAGRGVY